MGTKKQKEFPRPPGKPVVVTTAHKGVFFGWAEVTSGSTIRLARARNCIYWTADVRGFMGLAVTGPNKECRIGPAVEAIELRDITSVIDCSDDAVANWELGPWR